MEDQVLNLLMKKYKLKEYIIFKQIGKYLKSANT